MSKEVVIDPFTRIEGHLKIRAEVDDDGNVLDDSAYSSGTLFRGFENIIKGHDPVDAIHIMSRICGVCHLAHAEAATRALEEIYEVQPPEQGALMRDISNGAQNVEDHAEIVYALQLPDLANPRYVGDNGLIPDNTLKNELKKRFPAINDPLGPGESYLKAVETRKHIAQVVGIINGIAPHPRTFVPGGIASKPDSNDISKIAASWGQVVDFVEQYALGRPRDPVSWETWYDLVQEWGESDTPLADILEWINELEDQKGTEGLGDVPLFLKYGALNDLQGGTNLQMHRYGVTDDLLMSFEGYEEYDESWIESGIFDLQDMDAGIQEVDTDQITEDVSRAFYEDDTGGHPSEGLTEPLTDLEDEDFGVWDPDEKYSWSKAPRYELNGEMRTVEVGPLARMVIGDPTGLITSIATSDEWEEIDAFPVNTFTRMVARIHNLVLFVPKLLEWVTSVDLDGNFYEEPDWSNGKDSEGLGLFEPPRGALTHYIRTDSNGKVEHYQAVVPTTWNMTPRCQDGLQGPYEKAIQSIGPDKWGGLPEIPENPVQMMHTIRSFDPCIACAVHTIGPDGNNNKFDVWRT
ncbi:NiFe-hydrogenase I large subunit HyaB [Methanonatronarchaeum thermophilum]|uniref:NiFe-hydrogenase I large subunit HyaB n=1 Tax=Methanonatronarchaeum thermophilum TaxID=1927129 RepID=A0A1Y3GHT6_9EURY|nr:nickel-dependent hydrogenase large subunit [Methanonatronarchaeum thermophilum]OUJ18946.1 NiFe-hydrogenase I large subunit HyaB [Methanonatronarchaeum thermophilum]